MREFLSLYDYLGKPAGRVLGERVYKQARQFDIIPKQRQVDTKTYKGKVHLYTRPFLDYYFNKRVNG